MSSDPTYTVPSMPIAADDQISPRVANVHLSVHPVSVLLPVLPIVTLTPNPVFH